MEEFPGAPPVDEKLPGRCQTGSPSQESFLDRLWFAADAVSQIKLGGVCRLDSRAQPGC